MSRAKRRDFVTIVAVAVVLASALVLVGLAKVDAGKAPPPTCWWEGTVLHAADLPTTRPFGITFTRFPTGLPSMFTSDGTFERDFGLAREATFYTRGGGGQVYKFGTQVNDFHPICVAVP